MSLLTETTCRDGMSSKSKIKRVIVLFLLKSPPWQRIGNTFHYSKKESYLICIDRVALFVCHYLEG